MSVKLGDDVAIEFKRVGDRLVEPTRSNRKEDEAGVVRIQLETTTASPIRPPREGATRPYLSVQNNLDCPLSFRTLVRKAGSDKFFEVDLGMTPVPAGENAYHCWDFDAQEEEVVLFDFQVAAEVQVDSQSQLADPNQLQGRWQVVYEEVAGQANPAREVALIAMEFTDASLIQQRNGQTTESSYTVDTAQTPVTIDILPTDGNPVRGILDLRGDTLRLCTVEGASERPTTFDTQTTTPGVTYWILKRVLPVTAISSRGFSADIEEDFFRRESTSNSNYPTGRCRSKMPSVICRRTSTSNWEVSRHSPQKWPVNWQRRRKTCGCLRSTSMTWNPQPFGLSFRNRLVLCTWITARISSMRPRSN